MLNGHPIIVLLAAVVTANVVAYEDHSFKVPGPNDIRSPCPGLNSLANHGFLSRDGQNITITMILQARSDGYSLESHTIMASSKVGLLTSDDPVTISLDRLSAHGILGHDARIPREDFALSDNLHFNETVFTTLVNSDPGSDLYNTTSAGQFQYDRLADSWARNPNVTNTETVFREHQLPIEEGWKRSSIQITPDSLVRLAGMIKEESLPV
ncbi:hypothetical protein VNI00_003587 [Paramarasmius palmivorus]|uniref:Heme haloperoxidase family profile domain-containing protein n=1 Tax=Paramarasmius palmivorus TaxID=297713 RepID=A0AAW0DS44_9AGAR